MMKTKYRNKGNICLAEFTLKNNWIWRMQQKWDGENKHKTKKELWLLEIIT
jgi:hypothetical protein